MFEEMLVAIGDRLSDLASSDDGEDGEEEEDEETEQGNLSEDDEPGWVRGTITNTVQQRMERFRQKQMKLDEMTQPGWEDAANNFRERDKKYGTTELTVPAVVQPQTFDDAPEPPTAIYAECKDAYASVRRYMDMVANVDSSEYICRRVDVMVRLSLEI